MSNNTPPKVIWGGNEGFEVDKNALEKLCVDYTPYVQFPDRAKAEVCILFKFFKKKILCELTSFLEKKKKINK